MQKSFSEHINHEADGIQQKMLGKMLLCLQTLNLSCNSQMVESEFVVNNIEAWLHPASYFLFFIYIFSLYCTDCVISQMQMQCKLLILHRTYWSRKYYLLCSYCCVLFHTKQRAGMTKYFFIPEKAAISYVIVHHGHIWSKLIKQWDSLTSETIKQFQVQALIESKVEKESVGDVTILHKHKPLTSEHAACSSTVSSLYVRLCSPVQTEDTSKTALRCDRRTSAHQKPWRWNRPFHLNITASHMSSTGADMMRSKNIKTRGRGAQKIFTLL